MRADLIKSSAIQNNSPPTFHPQLECILSALVRGSEGSRTPTVTIASTSIHPRSPYMPYTIRRNHKMTSLSLHGICQGITAATTTIWVLLPYLGHKQWTDSTITCRSAATHQWTSWNIGGCRWHLLHLNKTLASKHGQSSQTWSCQTGASECSGADCMPQCHSIGTTNTRP